MSEMREKVKFAPNVERNLTLMFDSGKQDTSQYGTSYLWGVTEGGVEKSMFATETLNSLINALQPKKGDTITVKKVMEEGATTPHFTVNGKTMDNVFDGVPEGNIPSSFKDKVEKVIHGEFAGAPPKVAESLQLDRIEKKLDDFIAHVEKLQKVKELF